MNITFEGPHLRQLLEMVADGVRAEAAAQIEDKIQEAVESALEEKIGAAVETTIKTVLEEVLTTGWTPTDKWGQPAGKTVTLRERVSLAVHNFLESRDQYDRVTPTEKLVKEEIHKELQGATGKELERAKAVIREQVDAVMQAKLRETLSQALGLK